MSSQSPYSLLESIDSPASLRELPEARLGRLCAEMRAFIIESVSKTGGHLAANLGVVELTIALHRIFDTPTDQIVWDVGHQCYAHKALTGRREQLSQLRKAGGPSGFPKRDESEYDAFGAGHSSTSISAALGIAVAKTQLNDPARTIAVIGDGALTAGMAFEALNHAGDLDANLLVILNDNEMSISNNVGGLSKYLGRMLAGRFYSNIREQGKKVLHSMPPVWELARRVEEHLKGMVVPGTLFEELGFNYMGPIDGHHLPTLLAALKNLRSLKGPQFLHIVTRKGRGFAPAEENPSAFHGVGAFDPETGESNGKSGGDTFTGQFGQWLCDTAKTDPKLMAITPAMCEGSGMVAFREQFPDRFFDVGIAEQHALTFAAGLATQGLKPVVAIYATFLQRAYDQLIHDVALQNLNIMFAIDRGGLVGPDGATHDGIFDLAFMRCLPGMVIMTPSDIREGRRMLRAGYDHVGITAVRYPKGGGPVVSSDDDSAIEIGKGIVRRRGERIALLAFGTTVSAALDAAADMKATVADMRFVKPLDTALIDSLANEHDLLVTIEEGVVAGGAGSGVAEYLNNRGNDIPILHLGLPDRFQKHGERTALLAENGLDAEGIKQRLSGYNKRLAGQTSQ
jgi:1-deoxy-D-xylulose-5-phosphate synthase